MKEILIFAGTTEGRRLSEYLAAAGIYHTVCVATEYGKIVLKEHPMAVVHKGRMDRQEIHEFILAGDFAAVVDATHPYAEVITENIKRAMEGLAIPYYRLKREEDESAEHEKVTYFDSHEACARALEHLSGNILLTTGSKDLSKYCTLDTLKNRLYVRVLPGMESISACIKQGICGKQILALQGPFSEELNTAILHQYQIACMVTKESGKSGGFSEKMKAAEKAGIPVFVVGHFQKEEGLSFEQVCLALEKQWNQTMELQEQMEIILAGTGMGNERNLTKEAARAIEKADILLGAERMIKRYQPRLEKKSYYNAVRILPYLAEIQEKYPFPERKNVVILFSGDSGFYSGCQSLFQSLSNAIQTGKLKARLRVLPGISSVSYLAACVGESYQDAVVLSIHGRREKMAELFHTVMRHAKTFVLLSGADDMQALGRLLSEPACSGCTIWAGYQLSYPEQEIRQFTPEECSQVKKEGLYTCLIQNPFAQPKKLTPGIVDSEFIRDAVPMTKEEVREVSICKLKLFENAIVYDIGSGTGSVAVEIAGLSEKIQVFAIERKKEAVLLLQENMQRFQTPNITVIEAEAPENFSSLPVPTHAFVGGSGGHMQEILSELYRRNPQMRVVINAVSLETVCEIREALSRYPMKEMDIVEMQVNRVKEAGSHHLMQAQNPVFIAAFTFVPKEEEG